MINYTEKGFGLHERVIAAGHWLVERDGVWSSDDDAAVQAIIDAFSLADCQVYICQKIDEFAATTRDKLITSSPVEMALWAAKEADARVILANMPGSALLANEAAARGMDVKVLAAKIVKKADGYKAIEAEVAGNAGKHKDAVRATATFADALAYDWNKNWPTGE